MHWLKHVGAALGLGVAFLLPTTAMAATPAVPTCDMEFEWQVTSVSSPYTTYGSWVEGVSGICPVGARECQLSLSKTIGWSNTVSGTNEVGDSALSVAVGYSVTQSGSSTATYTIYYSGGQTAKIWWRNVYATKTVTQEEFYKYVCGGSWQPTGTYATAYTHRWLHFGYEGTIS
jgi:hypothetical protein